MRVSITGVDYALYGLTTREGKGSPLTHEELDRNAIIHLDMRNFDDKCADTLDEYPALVAAPKAPNVGEAIVVSPINGFCAISLQGTPQVGNAVEWGSGSADDEDEGWMYHNKFHDNTYGLTGELIVSDGDEYLLVTSTTDLEFRTIGNVNADIVGDVPYVSPPEGE